MARRDDPRRDDPTRVTEQPALTSSNGGIWLVVGAVLTAICLGVLLAVSSSHPFAYLGAAIALVLYAALVVVRFAVGAQAARLRVLAVLFAAIAVSTIVVLLLVISAVAP